MTMKGIVKDKGTGLPISGVSIYLTTENGEYVENAEGYLGTRSDMDGRYDFSLSPGQFLSFQGVGYPMTLKSYEQLKKNSTVVLNDVSGSALTKSEIQTYLDDIKKFNNGKWMISVGIGLFLIVILFILAKKYGWF